MDLWYTGREVVHNSHYIMWMFAHEFRYFVIYAKHKEVGLSVDTKRDSNIGSYVCLRRTPTFFFNWMLLMF
jgi:hypothetical protein